jgi:hypothetical protein
MFRIRFAGTALAGSLMVGAIVGSTSASAATGLSTGVTIGSVGHLTAPDAAQTGSMSSQTPKAINRGVTHAIPGTNCSITVGGWIDAPYYYPGVASQVSCSSRHTVQVDNQVWWAGTNGVPALFYQSGWYTYTNAYGTREIDNARAYCAAGRWDWLSGTQVYIDGIYRGGFFNNWGWWTACT